MARVGIVGASGFTGAELLRLAAGHPDLEVVLATGDTQAGTPVAGAVPEPGGRLPRPRLHPVRPRRLRRARPRVPRPAPRRQPGDRARAASARSATSSTSPPTSGSRTRRSTRSGTARRTPPPSCSPTSPTASPSCSATTSWPPPTSPSPGCYPTAAALAARPARAGRAWSSPPGIVVDAATGVSAPAGPRSRTPRSARSTRTSPPTGCSTTATRPRSSRPPGAPGALHPAPGPDEPGDPGHLLRPAHRRRPPPRRCSTCSATPTPTSRSWSSATRRRPPRPRSARTPPTSPPGYDERTGWVVAHRRHRQPDQGRLRPGHPVRQPRSSASPRPPASRSWGCTRDVGAPRRKGFVGARGGLRDQGVRRPRPQPRRHRRRRARRRRRRVHPEQDDRRAGGHHPRPPRPPPAARPPRSCSTAATPTPPPASGAWPTPRRCAPLVADRARLRARRGPRLLHRPHRLSRCRWTPSASGVAGLVAGRAADADGGDGRGRGDPHHRHRPQGDRRRGARASSSAAWPRAPPCSPRTWPRCSPCSPPTPTSTPSRLQQSLRAGVADSFNAMSVDGCTSTNDTVLLLASGRAGPPADLGRVRRRGRRGVPRPGHARWSATPRAHTKVVQRPRDRRRLRRRGPHRAPARSPRASS